MGDPVEDSAPPPQRFVIQPCSFYQCVVKSETKYQIRYAQLSLLHVKINFCL